MNGQPDRQRPFPFRSRKTPWIRRAGGPGDAGFYLLPGRARQVLGGVLRRTVLRSLSRLLFADEFVVDEKPEEVFDSAEGAKAGTISEDLVAAVGGMLRAQERMLELNEMLKATRGDESEELVRFIRRFLPRLDGFDRILEAFRSSGPTEEVNQWLRSLEGLYFKLQGDLQTLGLIGMETLGKQVDLDCMEVIDYRATKDYPHNTVIQEMKRGYRYKGKVLRDAQVIVARNERN